jgi:protein-L-isoaspartate(D-aspartate) O-methyltransferase
MKPSLKTAQEYLLVQLKAQGITQPEVLAAIETVPRHLFIEDLFQSCAYENVALPIDCDQTISQPYIVARMTELLLKGVRPMKRVLEIGTGSGYQAAVLAQIVEEVYSIERIKILHESAKLRLQNLNISNVHLLFGDGFLGWPEHAPFDGILVTAAPKEIPEQLVEQLAMGGRMILPLEEEGQQMLTVIDRQEEGLVRTYFDPVRFVPALHGTS